MAYSETYAALKAKYNVDNFEVIAEAIDQHLGDLFQLDVLNSECAKGGDMGSYLTMFDLFMKEFKGLYTTREVINKFYDLVQKNAEISNFLTEHFIFVPDSAEGQSHQIGFLEKIATDRLPVGESITFVDMLRGVHGACTLSNKRSSDQRVVVAHLKHFELPPEDNPLDAPAPSVQMLINQQRAVVINFNQKLDAPPKWGVLDLTQSPPRVYCEMPLAESEKKHLENCLMYSDLQYEGGTCNSLQSTGYTAYAWLDVNIMKSWSFDTKADFAALLRNFIFLQFGGDADWSSIYRFTLDEYARFCSKEFQHLQSMAAKASANAFQGGHVMTAIGYAAGLGVIEGQEFTPGDLTAVLKIFDGKYGKQLTSQDLQTYRMESSRTLPSRFDTTISRYKQSDKSIVTIDEVNESIKLEVPQSINTTDLIVEHCKACSETSGSPFMYTGLKFNLDHDKYMGREGAFDALVMVFTLLRAKAKQRKITIDLPAKYQLSEEEKKFVRGSLEQNVYVTEFDVPGNASLEEVKKPLLPTFARNRWLHARKYLPPMIDNYWRQAAKEWLKRLPEEPGVLELKEENEEFKRCVREMGLKGLRAVFEFLRADNDRQFIESLYGRHRPAFYAACQPHEYEDYLSELVQYLQDEAYFPFSELGIGFQPGYDDRLIELVRQINQLEQFDKVIFTDCLKNRDVFQTFLHELTKIAENEAWIGLVVIPELEDKTNTSDDLRALRVAYAQLNNVILHNRHIQAAKEAIKTLDDVSPSRIDASIASTTSTAGKDVRAQVAAVRNPFGNLLNSVWSLSKGGAVQLQLQQQQEIQQVRQLQQEQQKVVMQMIEEEALAGRLIDYTTIDTLIGDFYQKYQRENPVALGSAHLRRDDATALQNFFHTWINANPDVNAPGVIRKMTRDAAITLLRKHKRLPSGLNPSNLPRGFYTQPSKDGELILCYNPELGYVKTPNPLTLDLDVRFPKAEAWEGDFRQLNYALYTEKRYSSGLDEEDWENILLFAKLQPLKDYIADFTEFCRVNSTPASVKDNQDLIITHWPAFLQAWQYAGQQGIQQFLARGAANLSLDILTAKKILFNGLSADLQHYAKSIDMNDQYMRALGQLYYRYGVDGLSSFLKKLRFIEHNLGKEFFSKFNQEVLGASENFCDFVNENFYLSMDDMVEKLRPDTAAGNRRAWQIIASKHMRAVGWEKVETLWKGFLYFANQLELLGLTLDGDEFDHIPPENMLVFMNRIESSLKKIPSKEMKQFFLTSIKNDTTNQMDLTHGGINYGIQQEGFKFFDADLELTEFAHHTPQSPTYAPNLKALYHWSNDAQLRMRRVLASQARFTLTDYEFLKQGLETADLDARHRLVWLLQTQSIESVPQVYKAFGYLEPETIAIIGQALHQYAYINKQSLAIQFDAMIALGQACEAMPAFDLADLIEQYQQGSFFEAISILFQSIRWDDIESTLALFKANLPKAQDYPDYLYHEGHKLAVLFGVKDAAELQKFLDATNDLPPVVMQELKRLITHLLSIDYIQTDLEQLIAPENWQGFLASIESMKTNLATTATYRKNFLNELEERGIKFKFAKGGEFRALDDKDVDKPNGLDDFPDHKQRLWNFLRTHIAVPIEGITPQEALEPIMKFLYQLQIRPTMLNEIEPLLSSLEKTKASRYWSAEYFFGLLCALQPEDGKSSFPISMLNVMLGEIAISAKPLDDLEKTFSLQLHEALQSILQNNVFTRAQQAILCQLALREYNWTGKIELVGDIMARLAQDTFTPQTQNYALAFLEKAKHSRDLSARFDHCSWLIQHTSNKHAVVAKSWTETSKHWLKALSTEESANPLLLQIRNQYAAEPDKQVLLLHILAWSSLSRRASDAEAYLHELQKKAPKLIERLGALDMTDLEYIAKYYPGQPSPNLDDLLRLIKKQKTDEAKRPWKDLLDEYERNPHPAPRADFGKVSITREADLQRMIAATQVSGEREDGFSRAGISASDAVRLTLIFSFLKRLESGTEKVLGNKALPDMNDKDMAEAFKKLSNETKANPNDDFLRAQLWAVMFEALGRTTGKYPHLAQQFALLATDICVDAPTRVLQLATGEGKSHFVAMRTARFAGQGQVVDVCTAKRTLAERDLEDYQSLFGYLGLTSAYIHPKSDRETYTNSVIHYTTLGDLSLFLDEQSYSGHPINVPKDKRVMLFDEFDFIRFDEGRKTQYNYARPTGKTPKQMTWFYQAVNEFYKDNKNILNNAGHISGQMVNQFADFLISKAGILEERILYVNSLLRDKDPMPLVQWLQSAREADQLEWGTKFTVREENIQVGDETYPMREVIPLSSDMQKMVGSTFSAGVQQLLAVRLNTEALEKGEAQNFYIHPESNIISSQVAAQRMQELCSYWEGFTGTVSAAQAANLAKEHQTQVLHVPTNQRDLRFWHKPEFDEDQTKRLEKMVKQIRICLDKKQSILFSCKDDKQVEHLQNALQKYLTPEELAHFEFYTNEDPRPASQVLEDKREKENWHGGKKQKAIALVASGFGRGDNVGVEAVFLMDVNDTNDQLQKGGRTARNGEEGEVFQFYMVDSLKEEEARLLSILDALQIDRPDLKEAPGETDNEKMFERIMLLREYVFSLENAANEGYHKAIAQLSSWGMETLGAIEDPDVRYELTDMFGMKLKKLDKTWTGVSSKADLNADDKIFAMEAAVFEEVNSMIDILAEKGITKDSIKAFAPEKHKPSAIQLVVPKLKAKPTQESHAISEICNVLTHLADFQLNNDNIQKVSTAISWIVKEHPEKLPAFAKKIANCKSTQKFTSVLNTLLAQLSAPQNDWEAMLESAEFEPLDFDKLLTNVSPKTNAEFIALMDDFIPEIRTELMQYLSAPAVVDMQNRIEQILPLLKYLNTFDYDQQTSFGVVYIEQLDTLLNEREIPQPLLTARLAQASPMSVNHFKTLFKLAQHYAPESQTIAILDSLDKAVRSSPEQRIRMLTQWEIIAQHMTGKELAADFLTDFSTVMQHFKEGENWDTFVLLVEKTRQWWNKGGEGKYQTDLLTLWHQLAQEGPNVKNLQALIDKSLNLTGKSWFQNLLVGLSARRDTLLMHQAQVSDLEKYLDKSPLKRQAARERLKHCLHGINVFYDEFLPTKADKKEQQRYKEILTFFAPSQFEYITGLFHDSSEIITMFPELFDLMLDLLVNLQRNKAPVERVDAIKILLTTAGESQLLAHKRKDVALDAHAIVAYINDSIDDVLALNKERFEYLMKFSQTHFDVVRRHPEVYGRLLKYLQDDTISMEQIETLSDILRLTSNYQKSNPAIWINEEGESVENPQGFDINDLLLDVDKFMHTRNLSLIQLRELLEREPTYTASILHDIQYLLDEDLPEDCLHTLAEISLQTTAYHKQNPEESIQDLFADVDKFQHTRNLSLMHLHTLLEREPTYTASILHDIQYLLDEDLPEDCLQTLAEISLQTTAYHKQNPEESIQHLFADVDKFQHTRNLSLTHLHTLLEREPTYTAAILHDIKYLLEENIPEDCLQSLSAIALQAIAYHKQNPEEFLEEEKITGVSIKVLFEGVDKFRASVLTELEQLTMLIGSNPNDTAALLHNHAANYLTDNVDAGMHEDVRTVIRTFYKAHAENAHDPFATESIQAIFGFDWAPDRYKDRITLMHLLYHQVLQTDGDAAKLGKDHLELEVNDKLLDAGFERYAQYAQGLLDGTETRLEDKRSFNDAQQLALLKLTDELSVVTRPKLPKAKDLNFEPLTDHLNKLMDRYHRINIKSIHRREQLISIRGRVNKILEDHLGGKYLRILDAISAAKVEAMREDREKNKVNWMNFNSRGKSRYFNTLNQMQDMVVKHWVNDKQAIDSFYLFQAYNKEEFRELAVSLYQTIDDYQQKHPEAARGIKLFFGGMPQARKDSLTVIKRAINQFNPFVIFDDEFHVMESQAIGNFDKTLKDALPHLPGHIKALVNELLVRSESLKSHLEFQEQNPPPKLRK